MYSALAPEQDLSFGTLVCATAMTLLVFSSCSRVIKVQERNCVYYFRKKYLSKRLQCFL